MLVPPVGIVRGCYDGQSLKAGLKYCWLCRGCSRLPCTAIELFAKCLLCEMTERRTKHRKLWSADYYFSRPLVPDCVVCWRTALSVPARYSVILQRAAEGCQPTDVCAAHAWEGIADGLHVSWHSCQKPVLHGRTVGLANCCCVCQSPVACNFFVKSTVAWLMSSHLLDMFSVEQGWQSLHLTLASAVQSTRHPCYGRS